MMESTFFYVYVLLCFGDKKFYIGFTKNIEKRLRDHQRGLVRSTSSRRPVELIFFEGYRNRYDALRREKYLKSSKGKTTLRFMLQQFLEDILEN